MRYVATTELGEFTIELREGGKEVLVNGHPHRVDMQPIGDRAHSSQTEYRRGSQALFSLLVDNSSYEILVEQQGDEFGVLVEGKLHTVRVDDLERHRLAEVVSPRAAPKVEIAIESPMPGLVVSVGVKVGQPVSRGQVLVVLESMKMENEVLAPQDGVVQAIRVAAGDFVTSHQVLLVIK